MSTLTADIDLIKPDTGEEDWEIDWNANADSLDKFFAFSGVDDPNGNVASVFVGQRYLQTGGVAIESQDLTGRLWVATTIGAIGVAVWHRLSTVMAEEMAYFESLTWKKSQRGLWVDASPYMVANVLTLDLAVSNFFYLENIAASFTIENPDNPGNTDEAVVWLLRVRQTGAYTLSFTVGSDYIFQNAAPPILTPIPNRWDTYQFMRGHQYGADHLIEVSSIGGFQP